MLENSWSNKLEQQPLFATIVNLPDPAIIYQSQSNQLIAHYQTNSSPLPIRKDVLGIASLPSGQILLLTRYQLSCFDLLNNNELFNLQFENATRLYVEEDFIFVVCGCDLFCYNYQGEEQYVNHCSALIESLTTLEVKGNRQVIVGLNDLNLIRYKGVNITLDYGKIFGIPVSICCLDTSVLLGTVEGTVALYEGKKSKWKAKSNHPVLQIIVYRTESDYLAIIGRKDGWIELKDWRGKGQTLNKVKLHEELVSMHIHDFRKEDNEQLVCVLKSGNVKGLNIHETEVKVQKKLIADEVKLEQQGLQVLQNQKLTLEFQISQLKAKLQAASNQEQSQAEEAILRKDFSFRTYLNHEADGLVLQVICENGYISGLIFDESILPLHFDRLASIRYVFKMQNMVFGEIHGSILAHSNYTSKIYETLSFKIAIPKFWKYKFILEGNPSKPKIAGIKFTLIERNARYLKWVRQCFYLKDWTEEEHSKLEAANPLKLTFENYYDKLSLDFHFYNKENRVQIWCECLKTLGEVFQDLVEYVGVKELNSQLTFPKQKQKLKDTLSIIERLSQAKVSISSQMAEAIDNIKFLLVKGESARCVGSMNDLRRTYSDIMGFNRNLLTEIQKKNQNTKQLSESLKTLGQLINQTANVRYGKAKEQMVLECREAIKKKEFPKIMTIMERGATTQ